MTLAGSSESAVEPDYFIEYTRRRTKKWVEMETEYRWFLHHDDARKHTVSSAHMFLAKNNIHLFHSQLANLGPCPTVFLLEINLKCRRF